ncbi:anthranilate synthase component II [Flavobacterium litorale]|uniref:Aminodeoxychorismate/anthranilate synthase component II n=1 Tax=Flavobacterium litorale TaxID=2856519 RepID=A0ABX8V3V9_9FLAO|nr:aminodeoxychorismate/anthranilate synthase component II [Flavobacterium litorale]QYJ67534.1 aminodeoxychorismate/anthranilate synthase component II [Flavobacterium litorale]
MKKILVIDNYDSFTYNLVHYLEAFDCDVTIIRNDELDIDEVANYDKIVLSPGPGVPNDAGLLKAVIQTYAKSKSILGVCLGQQAIAEVFGGSIINLQKVYHGVATNVNIVVENEPLFDGLKSTIQVGRYHSWSVNQKNLPAILEVTATDDAGNIMALRHTHLDVKGVQFHPESVLTPHGKQLIKNWIYS